MTDFTGGTGDDIFTGSADTDTFDMTQGGDDFVRGLGGDDSFNFGAELTKKDTIFGGNGTDGLVLQGDYGNGVIFNDSNFRSVEQILLFGDFSFVLGFKDSALADNQVLEINVAFGEAQLFLFADEANAVFDVFAGNGDDVLATGGGNDILNGLDGGDIFDSGLGRDTLNGGDGEDRFAFSTGGLTRKDRIDGGDTTEVNAVVLGGDYSEGITLGPSTFTHINLLEVGGGNDYVVDLGKTTVETQLAVDALALSAENRVDIDGSGILGGGELIMFGGSGNDRFIGAGASDSLSGNLGADRLEGGGGADFYNYIAVVDSTGPGYDTVVGFNPDDDMFAFGPSISPVQAIDAKVTNGKLSDVHFDGNLENAIGAGELGESNAVAFRPDAGTLAGQTFLIVDCNHQGGYQAGEDLVFRLVNPQHLANLDATDFLPF